MNLAIGMKFYNYFSGATLKITNINSNIIEYNFDDQPSKIPYTCSKDQFHDWIKKCSKYPE